MSNIKFGNNINIHMLILICNGKIINEKHKKNI